MALKEVELRSGWFIYRCESYGFEHRQMGGTERTRRVLMLRLEQEPTCQSHRMMPWSNATKNCGPR
jgi:hypothetical protein